MGKVSSRFWLSYDLGLRGEYDALYTWLDRRGARECGDSSATFSGAESREEVAKSLAKTVAKGARLYLIGKKKDGRTVGGFVMGKRKAAPWAGFAQTTGDGVEEE
ncbi:MAG TPA: hypothetical protein VNF27_10595 [Candidatus Binataceae bacterium]|nr:hypothetical protein [Candidatus Binataceae bacterium]